MCSFLVRHKHLIEGERQSLTWSEQDFLFLVVSILVFRTAVVPGRRLVVIFVKRHQGAAGMRRRRGNIEVIAVVVGVALICFVKR